MSARLISKQHPVTQLCNARARVRVTLGVQPQPGRARRCQTTHFDERYTHIIIGTISMHTYASLKRRRALQSIWRKSRSVESKPHPRPEINCRTSEGKSMRMGRCVCVSHHSSQQNNVTIEYAIAPHHRPVCISTACGLRGCVGGSHKMHFQIDIATELPPSQPQLNQACE